MKLATQAKLLVDGYIDEVCLNLPKKKRSDIAVEIRSLIMDALEDRLPPDQPEIDEGAVLTALKELGPPLEMATSYHPHNYVIGPQLYAPFWITVRGTLLFMALFYLLGFVLSWSEATQSATSFGSHLWELIWQFLRNALQNFSVIFLIFVILDRILPEQDWIGKLEVWGTLGNIPIFRGLFGLTSTGEWDPQVLAASPKTGRVKRGETIFEIIFILLIAVLFNLFPHKIGLYGVITESGPWFAPLLAPTFDVYLPLWNLYWLLALGLNFVLLARRRWNEPLRWVELALMIFSGALVYWMLIGPPVLGLNPEYLALAQTSAEAVRLVEETLLPILTTLLQVALILHLVLKMLVIAYKFFKLVGRPLVITWRPINSHTDNP